MNSATNIPFNGTEQRRRVVMAGMAAAFAALTMFFAALASAYVVRRGMSTDWVELSLPQIVYLSVIPGLATSVVVETARKKSRQLVLSSAVFGIIFFYMMHAYAWRQIVHGGSSPAAAFFAIIDGTFSIAVVGGILALIAGLRPLANLSAIACYWHYLNALWISLLGLFYIWR